MNSLRAVTFNLRYGTADDGPNRWEHRRYAALEALKGLSPHILGVQECLPFQGDDIVERFPHFGRLGLGRYHGVAVPRTHEAYSGEHCTVFYDTRILVALESKTRWHSATPDVRGSATWGNSLPRVTTSGVFLLRDSDTRIAFMNTHLHWGEPYVSRAGEMLAKEAGKLCALSPLAVRRYDRCHDGRYPSDHFPLVADLSLGT